MANACRLAVAVVCVVLVTAAAATDTGAGGDLLVADRRTLGAPDAVVWRYAADGTALGEFTSGAPAHEFPYSMLFGPDGALYVVERTRLLRFDYESGAYTGTALDVGALGYTSMHDAVFVNATHVLAAVQGAHFVALFDVSPGAAPGRFVSGSSEQTYGLGVALDPRGGVALVTGTDPYVTYRVVIDNLATPAALPCADCVSGAVEVRKFVVFDPSDAAHYFVTRALNSSHAYSNDFVVERRRVDTGALERTLVTGCHDVFNLAATSAGEVLVACTAMHKHSVRASSTSGVRLLHSVSSPASARVSSADVVAGDRLVQWHIGASLNAVAGSAPMEVWSDSAAAHDAFAPAPNARPHVTDDAATGRRGVAFSGASQALVCATSPTLAAPLGGFVYTIVLRVNALPSRGAYTNSFFDRVWPGPRRAYVALSVPYPMSLATTTYYRFAPQVNFDDGSGLGHWLGHSEVALGRAQVVSVRRNGRGEFELWVDGEREATVADPPAKSFQPAALVVGNHADGLAGFDGVIFEMRIYSDALTESELRAMHSQLAAYYRVPVTMVAMSDAAAMVVVQRCSPRCRLCVSDPATRAPVCREWSRASTAFYARCCPHDCRYGESDGVCRAAAADCAASMACYEREPPTAAQLGDVCLAPPGDDLVLWLPFDGDARDVAHGYAGALHGAAAFAPGVVGEALTLDGSAGSHAEYAQQWAAISGAISVLCWVWPRSIVATGSTAATVIVDKGSPGTPDGLRVDVKRGGALRLITGVGVQVGNPDSPGAFHDVATLPVGVWTHVAITYDGFAVRRYLNGTLRSTVAKRDAMATNAKPLRIGETNAPSCCTWDGLIDEVMLWRRALGADELAAIVDQSLAPTSCATAALDTAYEWQRVFEPHPPTTVAVASVAVEYYWGDVTACGGGFVAVWDATAGAVGRDVFAQRYDALGEPLGASFRVNTYVADEQARPRAATLYSGDVVVVWQSNGQGGSGLGVYARVFSFLGEPRGRGDILVADDVGRDQHTAAVAALRRGGFAVAWQSQPLGAMGGADAHMRVFVLDSATAVSSAAHRVGNGGAVAIATLASGNLVVVYHRTGDRLDVFVRRYSADGVPIDAVARVLHADFAAGDQWVPSVAALADGGFVASWMGGHGNADDPSDPAHSGVTLQRFDSSGAAMANATFANSYIRSNQFHPEAIELCDGVLMVAWDSVSQCSSICSRARYFNSTSLRPLTAELSLHAGTSLSAHHQSPRLARLSSGGAVAGWHELGRRVLVRTFRRRGDVAPCTYASYGDVVLADAPLLYWPFDDANATRAFANRGLLGDAYGATLRRGSIVYVRGVDGRALRLDAAHITADAAVDAQRIADSRGSFSVEVWLRMRDSDESSVWWAGGAESGRGSVPVLNFGRLHRNRAERSHEMFVSYTFDKHSGELVLVTTPNVTLGAWQHWVVVVGRDLRVRLYRDGRVVGTASAAASLSQALDVALRFEVGGHPAVSGRSYRGDLDEFAFYDYALPADRILLHYRSGVRSSNALRTARPSAAPAPRLHQPTLLNDGALVSGALAAPNGTALVVDTPGTTTLVAVGNVTLGGALDVRLASRPPVGTRRVVLRIEPNTTNVHVGGRFTSVDVRYVDVEPAADEPCPPLVAFEQRIDADGAYVLTVTVDARACNAPAWLVGAAVGSVTVCLCVCAIVVVVFVAVRRRRRRRRLAVAHVQRRDAAGAAAPARSARSPPPRSPRSRSGAHSPRRAVSPPAAAAHYAMLTLKPPSDYGALPEARQPYDAPPAPRRALPPTAPPRRESGAASASAGAARRRGGGGGELRAASDYMPVPQRLRSRDVLVPDGGGGKTAAAAAAACTNR